MANENKTQENKEPVFVEIKEVGIDDDKNVVYTFGYNEKFYICYQITDDEDEEI